MGRPKRTEPPEPGKRRRDGRWRIFWRDGSAFEASAGPLTKEQAESVRCLTRGALRGECPFPKEIATAPAVIRWISIASERRGDGDDRLDQYETHLRALDTPLWTQTSLTVLRNLRKWLDDPILSINRERVQAWLDGKSDSLSAATIHKHRAILRRYLFWRGLRAQDNPAAGKQVRIARVPAPSNIVYFTQPLRERILDCARSIGGGRAVWIALYAGLRRSEIVQVCWEDLSRASMTIHIRVSSERTVKTARARDVPLHPALLSFLEETTPEKRRKGRIVADWRPHATDQEWIWDADRTLEALREAISAKETGELAALAEREDEAAIEAYERINPDAVTWNPFRHTVASLLAQAGVGLSKIADILGNSEEVCRRHYARFVAPNDPDILKLA